MGYYIQIKLCGDIVPLNAIYGERPPLEGQRSRL